MQQSPATDLDHSTQVSPAQSIRGLALGYAKNSQPDGADNNGNLLSQAISGMGLTGAATQNDSSLSDWSGQQLKRICPLTHLTSDVRTGVGAWKRI